MPERIPITEAEPQRPINPYGFSKLVVEQALEDYSHAYGFGFAALRYFNAAGASPAGDLGEDHEPESHLIPNVLQVALGQRPASPCSARTIPLRMELVFAITCTWMTWATPISRP